VRVLLLAHRYPPHGRGGVETWTRTLAHALTRGGHVVAVAARDDRDRSGLTPGEAATRPPFSRWEERESVGDDEVAVHWFVHRHDDARGYRSTWDDPRFDDPIATLMAAFRPDVVHLAHPDGWGRRPLEVARRAGLPTVVTLHDYKWICGRGQMIRPPGTACSRVEESRCARCLSDQLDRGPLRGTALRLLDRLGPGSSLRDRARTTDRRGVDQRRFPPARAARRWRARQAGMLDALAGADAVTSPSRFVADRHRASGLDRPIDVVRQGMDGGAEDVARAPGPLRVGWFGNPLPTKGLGFLLRAAAALPPGSIEVHVHGADSATVATEGVPDAPAVAHGAYPPEEAVRRMGTVDVVAIPSSWDENAPMVALEARWAGRPLLVSDRGGLPELVADDGWVEPLAAEAWAERLALIAARPAAAAEAAARAPEPRTAARMADDYVAVYARVVGGAT